MFAPWGLGKASGEFLPMIFLMSHFADRAVSQLRPPISLAASTTLSDRRLDHRRILRSQATLHVLDGPGAGASHLIVTRDQSLSAVSFLLRDPLFVGQNCRIDFPSPAGIVSHLAEVIRSRPLSNGRHEMAIQFSKSL